MAALNMGLDIADKVIREQCWEMDAPSRAKQDMERWCRFGMRWVCEERRANIHTNATWQIDSPCVSYTTDVATHLYSSVKSEDDGNGPMLSVFETGGCRW